ncbi:MAG: hypothetical protein R3F30_00255 [Planctomycetota bacterium]
MPRRDPDQQLRRLRVVLLVAAGMLLGAGLVLYGQVQLAIRLRSDVEGTFFLWRAIGEATFFLQDPVTQLALAMGDIHEDYIRESRRVAVGLLILGGLILGTIPFIRPMHDRR